MPEDPFSHGTGQFRMPHLRFRRLRPAYIFPNFLKSFHGDLMYILYLVDFTRETISGLPVSFPAYQFSTEKGSIRKGNHLLLHIQGVHSLLLEYIPFLKGANTMLTRVNSLETLQFPLRWQLSYRASTFLELISQP